ncbi:hypothetical protein [Nocardia abscessus]|uniref:hypothetical protein n=1 Tax=Nocardia abscessus TaxID=120957 RepID=UPI0002E27A3D|nr:hypothetical protein [Nocardia abscessus]MCC3328337.1 hypothetical protein [Nocardia abscessus]
MKRQAFTPESLFRVSTLGLRDRGDDPYVQVGPQLRSWVNPAIGFPLRGFTFAPLTRDSVNPDNGILVRPLQILWWTYDDAGRPEVIEDDPQKPVKIQGDRPIYGDIVDVAGDAVGDLQPWISWLRLDIDEHGPVQMAILGRAGSPQERILLTRNHFPFALASTRIRRIRLLGEGVVTNALGLDLSRGVREFIDPAPERWVRVSLPLDSATAWADAGGSADGRARAAQGAARHSGPPNAPVDRDLGDGDELARLHTLLTGVGDTSVQPLLEAAYADPATYPGDVQIHLEIPGERQSAQTDLGNIATLITAAADPGIARWLGLCTPAGVDLDDESVPMAWIGCGLWAARPSAVASGGPPATTIDDMRRSMGLCGPPTADVNFWISQAGGPDAISPRQLAEFGLIGLPLFTPAVIGAVPDRPPPPQISADGPGPGGHGQWTGANTYIQDLAIAGPPPANVVAFTRTVDGATSSLHAVITADDGTQRAVTLLPARRETITGCVGALTDPMVPSDSSVTWHVAEGDEFGRWGKPASLDAQPPPRPPLPAPTGQISFAADFALRDAPPGLRSPGLITVSVDVPPPDALGAGCPPITTVSVNADTFDAPFPDDKVTYTVAADATDVGQTVDRNIDVIFKSQAGNASSVLRVRVVDPRRPAPIVTAASILWTTRPNPAGSAEIDLRWSAAPGHAGYRVYLADERVIAAQLGVDPASSNRATRAAALCEHQHQPMKREAFTLITNTPLVAGGDGAVRLVHPVGGALQSVQFVRIVPVSGAEVEAPFNDCGLVPVAIPAPDAPPAAAVRVGGGGGGDQLTVEVDAHGVNATVIERLQCGLPDAPEYRIQCSDAATGSYLYGALLDEGKLVAAAGYPDTYHASVPADTLAKLPAFISVALTAQVRYPAEVSTMPGAVPLPSPVGRTAGPLDHQPSQWSAPSAPITVMRTAPAPDYTATARRSATGVDLVVAGLPVNHPKQVAPWRLMLWRKTTDGDMQLLHPANATLAVQPAVSASADGWEVPTELRVHDTEPQTEGYLAVLIDPLGVAGPAKFVAVA